MGYVFLLAIPVVIAAALFIYNGSGYRLSEQDAADVAYKMRVLKPLRFPNQQSQKHVQACMAVIRLVSQHQTITLITLLMVNLGLF